MPNLLCITVTTTHYFFISPVTLLHLLLFVPEVEKIAILGDIDDYAMDGDVSLLSNVFMFHINNVSV